ncbi:MAG: endonuclease/exonuclease/phosphatase family protein [Kiritimatiellae bacterium]|nr:endonuclease/exonuclease/phosphatase family protein [Kiritimatiellia bacterium]
MKSPARLFYPLALLVALLLILFLLTRPQPGVQVTILSPLAVPRDAAPAVSPSATSLRIATYNLENYTDGDFDAPARTPAAVAAQTADAAAIIARADPDILFLQEIENAAALRRLNAALPAPYPYAYITRYRTGNNLPVRINEALLSRVAPVEVRQLSFNRLPSGARPARGALAARFALAPGRDLLAYGMHLKSNFGIPYRNIAQRTVALHLLAADAAAERFLVSDRADLSVLLLGDTNVDPDAAEFAADPSLDALVGGYVDLWRGRPLPERTTLPTRQAGPDGDTNLVFRPAAFDRIFASRDLAEDPASPAARPPLPPLPLPPDAAADLLAAAAATPLAFPYAPAPRYRVSPPVALPLGCATNDNLLVPGYGGHVSDHYLVYLDLSPAP